MSRPSQGPSVARSPRRSSSEEGGSLVSRSDADLNLNTAASQAFKDVARDEESRPFGVVALEEAESRDANGTSVDGERNATEAVFSSEAVSLGKYMQRASKAPLPRRSAATTGGSGTLTKRGLSLDVESKVSPLSLNEENARRSLEKAVKLLHPSQLGLLSSVLSKDASSMALSTKRRAPQLVISEDQWEAALDHIVRRDFFPDIPLLRLVRRLLEAEARKDASAVSALAKEIKALAPATPLHLPSLKRRRQEQEKTWLSETRGQQAESEANAETEVGEQQQERVVGDDFGGAQTPVTSTVAAAETFGTADSPLDPEEEAARVKSALKDRLPIDLSLDQFMQVVTSEDRRSVQALLDREKRQREERRGALWNQQKSHNEAQLALFAQTAQGEKADRVAVNFHPGETSLFFRGAGGDRAIPNTVPREGIRVERTRFTTLQRQVQLQQMQAQLRAREEQRRQRAVYEVVQQGEFRPPPPEKPAPSEGLASQGFGAVPLSVPVDSAPENAKTKTTWGARRFSIAATLRHKPRKRRSSSTAHSLRGGLRVSALAGSLLGTPVLLHVEQATPIIAKALAATAEEDPLPAEVPTFQIPEPRRREAVAARLQQQSAEKVHRREARRKLRKISDSAAVAARVAREALGLSGSARSFESRSSEGSVVFAAASSALQKRIRSDASGRKSECSDGRRSEGRLGATSSSRRESDFCLLQKEMLRSPLVKSISDKHRAAGTVDLQLRAAYSSRKSWFCLSSAQRIAEVRRVEEVFLEV